MRVLQLKDKKEVMKLLPDSASMIVLVFHEQNEMYKEQEDDQGTENETEAPEMEGEAPDMAEDALEYTPPGMA